MKSHEDLKTLRELEPLEDLDDFEKRARQVYHELLDFLQLVWRAKAEQHLIQDLIKSTIKNKTKLSFVESTTSDPTCTQCNLQLNQSFMQFRGWNAVGENEQGLSIVLSVYQGIVDSEIVWPAIRFSPFASLEIEAGTGIEIESKGGKGLASFTHPEAIPKYFQKMIFESLEDNGFAYVPYQESQRFFEE